MEKFILSMKIFSQNGFYPFLQKIQELFVFAIRVNLLSISFFCSNFSTVKFHTILYLPVNRAIFNRTKIRKSYGSQMTRSTGFKIIRFNFSIVKFYTILRIFLQIEQYFIERKFEDHMGHKQPGAPVSRSLSLS